MDRVGGWLGGWGDSFGFEWGCLVFFGYERRKLVVPRGASRRAGGLTQEGWVIEWRLHDRIIQEKQHEYGSICWSSLRPIRVGCVWFFPRGAMPPGQLKGTHLAG